MAATQIGTRYMNPDKPRHVTYHCGPLRGLCEQGYESFDLTSIPWDTLRNKPDSVHELAKKSRTRRVIRLDFAPVGRPTRGVFAKRVRVLDRRKMIGALLIPSKTRHEWKAGHRLLDMGISTCRPVIFAEDREGRKLKACYLVTEEIQNAGCVADELASLRSRRTERRSLLVAMAHWLWRAHRQGFYHDDCSVEHVFVGPAAEGTTAGGETQRRFWFIDLDNSRFHWLTVPWRRRVKNLFQLLRSIPLHLASRTDRLHFVLAYLKASGERRRLRRAVAGMRRLARRKKAKIYL